MRSILHFIAVIAEGLRKKLFFCREERKARIEKRFLVFKYLHPKGICRYVRVRISRSLRHFSIFVSCG